VWFWLLIAVVILFAGCAALVTAASVAVNHLNKKKHTVIYAVTGDGRVDITYDSFTSGSSGSAQVTDQILPWTKTIVGSGIFNIYNLSATIVTGSTVTCSITVDGQLLSTRTSTGQFASVTCDAAAT